TSAGNLGEKDSGGTGYTRVTSPCNAPSAICVGSAITYDTLTRSDDVGAPYSSRGPSWDDAYQKPDVRAPGHDPSSDTSTSSYLYQTLTSSHEQAANGLKMLELSGTSMAAGVATGVIALMVDAHDNDNVAGHQDHSLTPNLAKALLQYTAIKLPNADYL